MKLITKCLYCGHTEKVKFNICPKCNETKYLKTKEYKVNYYEDVKPEENLSIDFDAMMEYYNNNED